MATGRRLSALLIVLTVLAVPAVVARAFCIGRACVEDDTAAAAVPFCPLPNDLRTLIVDGFYAGRSPDVMAAASGSGPVATTVRPGVEVAWPSIATIPATRVPLAFFGDGVAGGVRLTGSPGLDQVAPTLAALLRLRRPHPEVRAGRPIREALLARRPVAPAAVFEIAWEGVGTSDLRARPSDWPFLRSAIAAGAGTQDATTGSLPVDPAAVLATIGTGGLPKQHGIVGTDLRAADGRVVRAWGPDSPPSVIASLGDDLDRASGQRSLVGSVLTDIADRGIVGGTWYLGADRDPVTIAPKDPVVAVRRYLARGWGRADGSAQDLLGVVLDGSIRRMDRATASIVRSVRNEGGIGPVTFVVTATGSLSGTRGAVSGATVSRGVERAVGAPAVARAAAGGLFLDDAAMATADLSSDDAVQAMNAQAAAGGSQRFADAFPAFAVAFARYC